MKKIAIGADHAGFELKQQLCSYFDNKKIDYKDFGTYNTNSVDYPDVIHPLAKSVNDGYFETGIIICGSGNGVAITANKYPDIRAALCWNTTICELARKHNDANVLSLPARFITFDEAVNIVLVFLTTAFEGGRHQIRVNKIKI
jgi:ribose 5-phosphate isomerase B